LQFLSPATLSNAGTLNLPTGGTLDNATAGALTIPTVSMTGGTLSGTQGYSSAATSGYGTIAADLTNTGSLTASGSGQTLTVTGAVSGSGNVFVGANAGDSATLALQNNLGATDLTLNQSGILDVTPGNLITLSGSFYNNATSTSQWLPAAGIALSMTGSTFEVAGYDYGAVATGFSNNFNLASLYLPASATLQLVDDFNNGNQGGIHGTPEALYITSLTGLSGALLDLNHLWVYLWNDGSPIALGNGLYNGIMVENSPVPLPSTLLLLGSGLLGLAGLGYRRIK